MKFVVQNQVSSPSGWVDEKTIPITEVVEVLGFLTSVLLDLDGKLNYKVRTWFQEETTFQKRGHKADP